MARFKCTNENCQFKDKEIIVEKTKWVFDSKVNKLVTAPILCKECSSVLEFIPNETIPILHFNQFDSLSTQQKRAVINKRASNHMRKTGEDKSIADQKRRTIEDNKRMITGK